MTSQPLMTTRWSFHFWLKQLFTIVWHAHLFAILYQQVMLSNTMVTPSICWRYLKWQFSIYCSGGSWLHPLNNCTTFQPTQNKGSLDILMTLNQGLTISMMTCRALMTMTTCYVFCSCMLVGNNQSMLVGNNQSSWLINKLRTWW